MEGLGLGVRRPRREAGGRGIEMAYLMLFLFIYKDIPAL